MIEWEDDDCPKISRNQSRIVLIARNEQLLYKILQCCNGSCMIVEQLVVGEIRNENLPLDAILFMLCDMRVEKEALFFDAWHKWQPRLLLDHQDVFVRTYIHTFASNYQCLDRYAPVILLMVVEFDLSNDVALLIASLWYHAIDREISQLRLYNRNRTDCSALCDEHDVVSMDYEIYSDNKLFV